MNTYSHEQQYQISNSADDGNSRRNLVLSIIMYDMINIIRVE